MPIEQHVFGLFLISHPRSSQWDPRLFQTLTQTTSSECLMFHRAVQGLSVGSVCRCTWKRKYCHCSLSAWQSEVSVVLAVGMKMCCCVVWGHWRFLNPENDRIVLWWSYDSRNWVMTSRLKTLTRWTCHFAVAAERPVRGWPHLNKFQIQKIFPVCMQLLDTYKTRWDHTWFAK